MWFSGPIWCFFQQHLLTQLLFYKSRRYIYSSWKHCFFYSPTMNLIKHYCLFVIFQVGFSPVELQRLLGRALVVKHSFVCSCVWLFNCRMSLVASVQVFSQETLSFHWKTNHNFIVLDLKKLKVRYLFGTENCTIVIVFSSTISGKVMTQEAYPANQHLSINVGVHDVIISQQMCHKVS